MANSSRDPYWQASVRRESIDHPEAKAEIEDECSVCHMPITRYEAHLGREEGRGFFAPAVRPTRRTDARRRTASRAPCATRSARRSSARARASTAASCVDPPDADDNRPEYGPYEIEKGHKRIMRTSSEGYRPTKSDHIRKSELCATCHTLYTKALGPGGKVIGELPEQMPYQEWLHSEYKDKQSCQYCHMPVIQERGADHARARASRARRRARHTFVGGELLHAADAEPLPRRAVRDGARAGVDGRRPTGPCSFCSRRPRGCRWRMSRVSAGRLQAEVVVENLGGHKLPTAYPSRRAWLHVIVRDREPAARSSNPARSSRTGRSRATTTTRTRTTLRAALRARSGQPRPGPDLRVDHGGSGRRGDDGTADGRALREGQPAAAARIRQADCGQGHRGARRGGRRTRTSPDAGDRVRYSVAGRARPGSVRRWRPSCCISRSATGGRTI